MASYFRQKIAQRIASSYRNSHEERDVVEHLAKLVRVNKRRSDNFQFVLPFQEKNISLFSGLEDIINKIKDDECIVDVEANKNEFTFSVSTESAVQEIVDEILRHPSSFWKKSCLLRCLEPKKIITEYSSPNIAKPFHAGHLRSTVIGQFVSNLKRSLGHNVVSINYLGDWGTQFGLLGTGFEEFGSEQELEKNPIRHLFEVYVAANKVAAADLAVFQNGKDYFARMENGDENVLKQWRKFRELSITDLKSMYRRLGVKFDYFHGESMYGDKTKLVFEELEKSGILTQCEGSFGVELDVKSKNSSKISKFVTLKKSDGSTLYLSRDIAAAIDRKSQFNFDQMFYVVENGQSDHFTSLTSILKRMGRDWHSSIQHVKYGRIHNISTRKGNVVFLSDILDEAKERTLKSMEVSPNTRIKTQEEREKTADILGTTAVLINDLKNRRQANYEFSWDRILQTKGNSGLQVQYTHARLWSLEKNCGVSFPEVFNAALVAESSAAVHLAQWLSRFDEVLKESDESLEPCTLVHYVFNLCNLINVALSKLPIKGEPLHVAESRLCLFVAARNVLGEALQILGIKPLKEM